MNQRSEAEGLWRMGHDAAWFDKKPRKAISLLREAMIADPKFVEPQLEMAKVYYHYLPEKLHVAFCAIGLYVRAQPDSAEGQYYLGLIESSRGNVDKSDSAFRRAMELDPFDTRPLVSLALSLLNREKASDALPLLEQAVEWYSVRRSYAEPATRLSLADAYEQTGDVAKAVSQWKIVTELPEVWPEDEGAREEAHQKLKKYL